MATEETYITDVNRTNQIFLSADVEEFGIFQ